MKQLYYLFIVWGIYFPIAANAQLAIVSSKDGYANMRTTPSLNGTIATPLQNNTVVLIDELQAEEHPDTDWSKVYLGIDPYCKDCTSSLSKGYVSGYVHSSQLKNIDELATASEQVFSMKYTLAPFHPSDKNIVYIENSEAIQSINGRDYFGSDCGTPQTEITQAKATVNGRTFNIPLDLVWSVLHAQNNFRYFQYQKHYFALQGVGDGACTTNLVWVFDQNGLKQRMLGWSF